MYNDVAVEDILPFGNILRKRNPGENVRWYHSSKIQQLIDKSNFNLVDVHKLTREIGFCCFGMPSGFINGTAEPTVSYFMKTSGFSLFWIFIFDTRSTKTLYVLTFSSEYENKIYDVLERVSGLKAFM